MEQIQLIAITPEQLENAIINGVKKEIDSLKKHFQPQEPTQYLSRKDVAAILNTNTTTIFRWTKAKKLKAYGIGNRVYYKRHEVEQAIIALQE